MATVQEMLQAKGILLREPREKKTGGGGKVAQVVASPTKFTFRAPPAVPKLVAKTTLEERAQNAEILRQFRHDVVVAMFDHVNQIRAIDALADEDERTTEAGARKESCQAIATMLSYEEPSYKESALLAYADALVKTCPEFRSAVVAMLDDLCRVGFLTEVAEGKGIRIYGQYYALAEGFSKNSEARAVGESISQLVSRTVAAGKERFEADFAAIKTAVGENPLSIAELKAGKDGRIILETPNHQHRERFFKGGFLLLELSSEGQIRVLDGAGGCQRIARQLAEAGVFIWNTQLDSERLEMKERLPEEVFRNALILHGLIYRGVAEAAKAEAVDQRKAEFKEQVAAERETLKGLATLTPVEFFLFERVGTTVLDPLERAPFKVFSQKPGEKPTLIYDVFALIEREETGRIRVADCPERLNFFFADFRDFVPAGEKFSAIRWPFRVLLRMGYAAALAVATPEQKAAAQAEAAQAETARQAAKAEGELELAARLAAGSGEDLSGMQIPDPNEGR